MLGWQHVHALVLPTSLRIAALSSTTLTAMPSYYVYIYIYIVYLLIYQTESFIIVPKNGVQSTSVQPSVKCECWKPLLEDYCGIVLSFLNHEIIVVLMEPPRKHQGNRSKNSRSLSTSLRHSLSMHCIHTHAHVCYTTARAQ